LRNGRYDDIEVLKVPHHGSKNGLTKNFLEVVDPEKAIISAGKDNRFGHPHEEVVELLKKHGIKILRTDVEGEIVIKNVE
jgi:competence protein ComEC